MHFQNRHRVAIFAIMHSPAPSRSASHSTSSILEFTGTGHRRRLRERILQGGLDAMAPYELLEVLLTFAIARGDTKPLAKDLLAGTTLGGLLSRPPAELLEAHGVGPHAACLMGLVRRIHGELVAETEREREICRDPEELAGWFRSRIGLSEDERFAAVFLDQAGRILGREVFEAGSRTRTVLYPRRLFEAALRVKATGVVLCHNHPGGSLHPSAQDRELTRKVQQIGESLEVVLVDHLVVTRSAHVSFRRSGWM